MLNLIRKWQVYRAVRRMQKQGKKEILHGQIMIEFYKWQISIAPENASEEDLGKLELKIKQMEDIIANNQRLDTAFSQFLKS